VSRRLRNAVDRCSIEEFDAFARASVAQYGRFLDMLSTVTDSTLLRICSVFPAGLADASWAAGYIKAHKGSPESDCRLADALRRLKIPDFATRAKLRAFYNTCLHRLCDEKNLVFIDELFRSCWTQMVSSIVAISVPMVAEITISTTPRRRIRS
jgi:hypothetical protein